MLYNSFFTVPHSASRDRWERWDGGVNREVEIHILGPKSHMHTRRAAGKRDSEGLLLGPGCPVKALCSWGQRVANSTVPAQ